MGRSWFNRQAHSLSKWSIGAYRDVKKIGGNAVNLGRQGVSALHKDVQSVAKFGGDRVKQAESGILNSIPLLIGGIVVLVFLAPKLLDSASNAKRAGVV